MADLRQRLWEALMGQPAYQAPASEFTTPGDLQRERVSGALGWDVGPVDSWAPGYAARELGNRAWQLGLAMPVGRVAPRPQPQPGPWAPGHMEQWLASRSPPPPQPPRRTFADKFDDAFFGGPIPQNPSAKDFWPVTKRAVKHQAPYWTTGGIAYGVGQKAWNDASRWWNQP